MIDRLLRGRLHDPDRVILRRALRVAAVSPALFAITGFVLDRETMALFASFGSFSALALADLGGPLKRRFVGYLVMTAVGTALIAIGTALAHWVVTAAVGMAVVGFTIRFLGVLGGYFAASGFAVTLAFVLAVALPTAGSPLGDRLLGWIVGGMAAAVAAVVLWPARERRQIETAMADACRALADLIDALSDDADVERDEVAMDHRAADAVSAARERFRASPFRPSGLTVRDRAAVHTLRCLPWILDLARLTVRERPVDAADATLLKQTAADLRRCAEAVVDDSAVPLRAEIAERAHHRDLLIRRVTEGLDVAALQRRFGPRALSYAVLSLAVNIAVMRRQAVPTSLDPAVVVEEGSVGSLGFRTRRTFSAHLRPDSVRFRDAMRVGVALGVAIAVALIGDLPHAFWVALGTLSVLRGNALSTGYTVAQSLLGTLIGFGLAAGLVSITPDQWFLWVLLPITAFLAAYTPSAIHFVLGQASFTMYVVVLFNLLVPEGWRTGLVRLGDIALGTGLSLVISIVFWPRGASAQLRTVAQVAIAANGRYAADAVADRLGPPGADDRHSAFAESRRVALAANRRIVETFITFLGERGRRRLSIDTAEQLLTASLITQQVAGALELVPTVEHPAGPCRGASRVLIAEANEVRARLQLDGANQGAGGYVVEDGHGNAIDAIRRCAEESARTAPASVLGLAWTSAWLEHLGDVAAGAERADREAATATARQWWA